MICCLLKLFCTPFLFERKELCSSYKGRSVFLWLPTAGVRFIWNTVSNIKTRKVLGVFHGEYNAILHKGYQASHWGGWDRNWGSTAEESTPYFYISNGAIGKQHCWNRLLTHLYKTQAILQAQPRRLLGCITVLVHTNRNVTTLSPHTSRTHCPPHLLRVWLASVSVMFSLLMSTIRLSLTSNTSLTRVSSWEGGGKTHTTTVHHQCNHLQHRSYASILLASSPGSGPLYVYTTRYCGSQW